MPPNTPEDIFLDDLCRALTRRGGPVRERERALAGALGRSLWSAVLSLRSPDGFARAAEAPGKEHLVRRIETARSTAKALDKIGRQATHLPSGPLATSSWFGLREEAPRLAATLRAGAKRAPGRQASEARRTLSVWVAVSLARAGVPLTKGKTGVYARVLSVVQREAGFGDRTPADVERDVRHALSDPFVTTTIARIATQKPPKKVRMRS
jgi:hypothetical protein